MKYGKYLKTLATKIFTVTLLAVFLLSNSAITSVFTNQKALEASQAYNESLNPSFEDTSSDELASQREPGSRKSFPIDKKASELIGRLSEYENFTEEEKQYIQSFLGIFSGIAEDNSSKNASAEVILADLLDGKVSFDTISGSDWEKIAPYFGSLSDTQIEALSDEGYSAADIFSIGFELSQEIFFYNIQL